ncbi:uncharacterized protein LOC124440225 [Xenia sp. Carnegie-2017]|uniref:uncharacterized protein LOC124440225 n=1 Tax=Xenia sp. Carnegie-2017 TaxID=2897299 RepID=UPI001F035CDD|nr:uncharacterized protein LOC124440225 [Xenia sp. Carnegie-2017]
MSKRRRNNCQSVDDLRKDVNKELHQEYVGSRILSDIQSINLKVCNDLNADVILFVLVLKYGLSLVCSIANVASSLLVLPVNVRKEVLALVCPNLEEEDVNVLLQSASKLKVPSTTDRKLHVFTPPCSKCIKCNHDLVRYNKPVKVQVHDLSGTTDGVKVSLRCNRCNLLYGYSKYGNGKDGWMLYPEQRKMTRLRISVLLIQLCFSGNCHSHFGEKQVAASFWVGEMENELRELGQLDFFGLLKEDGDSSRVLEQIDKIRARSLY